MSKFENPVGKPLDETTICQGRFEGNKQYAEGHYKHAARWYNGVCMKDIIAEGKFSEGCSMERNKRTEYAAKLFKKSADLYRKQFEVVGQ